MPSNIVTASLRDMEHHINLATNFIAGLDYEAFWDDTRTVYAVTRCLESYQKRPVVSRMR